MIARFDDPLTHGSGIQYFWSIACLNKSGDAVLKIEVFFIDFFTLLRRSISFNFQMINVSFEEAAALVWARSETDSRIDFLGGLAGKSFICEVPMIAICRGEGLVSPTSPNQSEPAMFSFKRGNTLISSSEIGKVFAPPSFFLQRSRKG
ncbi:hypothetical protein N8650_02510 [Akkermansiaceae bacterium]|nr:hypothetical protein [Akkermansiaceae bacterium]